MLMLKRVLFRLTYNAILLPTLLTDGKEFLNKRLRLAKDAETQKTQIKIYLFVLSVSASFALTNKF